MSSRRMMIHQWALFNTVSFIALMTDSASPFWSPTIKWLPNPAAGSAS